MNHPDDPQRVPVSARFRLILAGLLAVLLVAATTWLVIALLGRADDDTESKQHERDAAMAAADTFVSRYFTYSKDDLDADGHLSGYVEALEPLITAEARAELEEAAAGLEELIARNGFARTTQIDRTGVQSLGPDEAEVLVVGVFTDTRNDKPAGSAPFQMVVDLDKVDGDWRVNDFGRLGEEQ